MLSYLVTQSLNALSQAALLFFLAVGLTVIFGIMKVINFAHGALFMFGAYVGYSVQQLTGSFWVAVVVAPILVGIAGGLFELVIVHRLYHRPHTAFLLVTFGLALALNDIVRLVWGPAPLQVTVPPALSGVVFILDEPFPVYRLLLIAAGVVMSVGTWLIIERTRAGLLIRATSQNADMVGVLGVDVRAVRCGVFAAGTAFAALGGVLAAPLITASLGTAANVINDAFVIVIIGGMGSIAGSLVGAVILAFVQTFGNYYFPDLALALMYLLMVLVLVIRPAGLLGKEG